MRTTDTDYNAQSRQLEGRVLIYFDKEPIVITRNDYLLTFDTFDDLGFAKDSPVQSLVANEATFVLLNDNKRFSPTNYLGPYYGKIKQGVQIIVQIRPVIGDYEWDNLGVFYVTDWNISYDGLRATVTALDKSQDILTDSSYPDLPVTTTDTEAYIAKIFGDLSYNIIGGLPNTPYLFPKSTRKETLNGLLNAKKLATTCDRYGVIQVGSLPYSPVARSITDNDQIVDIEATNAFIMQYNDATVVYSIPEVQIAQSLLSLTSIQLNSGNNDFNNATLASKYVKSIDYASVESKGPTSFMLTKASATQCSFKVNATAADAAANISIFGSHLNLPLFTLLGDGRCVKVQNEYVQSAAEAELYKQYLTKFVTCPNQTIKVKVRGNPHITLGSVLNVASTKYAMNFSGIVVESGLTYDGGLSGYLILLSADAIGG